MSVFAKFALINEYKISKNETPPPAEKAPTIS